jgi:bifunctional N-acetylglucosamine-1-phosphate-uridyltransferase/glucosamine-1-phosphate-acetyltransferase GlmU-like protein
MKALIQAGGKGTRLQSIAGPLPKPMVAIGGKPILQWQIEGLVKSGITDIVIVISPNGKSYQIISKTDLLLGQTSVTSPSRCLWAPEESFSKLKQFLEKTISFFCLGI